MKTQLALAALAALSVLLAACSTDTGGSPGATTPATTPAATPTPIAADVASPEDAAALVIATDPRFAGAEKLNPEMIGASKYWEAQVLDGGAYQITLTLGWGDCPSGCINRHTWVYEVTGSGEVSLIEESGDPVPAGNFPPADA